MSLDGSFLVRLGHFDGSRADQPVCAVLGVDDLGHRPLDPPGELVVQEDQVSLLKRAPRLSPLPPVLERLKIVLGEVAANRSGGRLASPNRPPTRGTPSILTKGARRESLCPCCKFCPLFKALISAETHDS